MLLTPVQKWMNKLRRGWILNNPAEIPFEICYLRSNNVAFFKMSLNYSKLRRYIQKKKKHLTIQKFSRHRMEHDRGNEARATASYSKQTRLIFDPGESSFRKYRSN